MYQGCIFIVLQSGWTLRMHKEPEKHQIAKKNFMGKISTPN